jgi:PII-like signaling protein
MRGIEGEQALLRIILSESRTHGGTPLHRVILDLLRAEGLAGATVLKGQAGFGYDREVHTVAIEVAAVGLPIVLEVVDTEEADRGRAAEARWPAGGRRRHGRAGARDPLRRPPPTA